MHIVDFGNPENSVTCLAGAWPTAAWTTFPKKTSLISSFLIPALLIASSVATAPNWVADSEESDPKNDPIGVRTADTITTSFFELEL